MPEKPTYEELEERIHEFERAELERKQTKEDLQLTQFSVDNSMDAAYWMGPDAKFIYVNYAAVKALGYSKEELLTMTVHDIGPEFPADVWPAHWAELKEKKSLVIQTIHQRKDESVFPVEISVNLFKFGSREINCAIARDITERKQAEQALRESEVRFRTILDKSPIPTAVGGLDGSIESFNKALEQLIGYNHGEIIDANDWACKLYPNEEYREFVQININQALEGKEQDHDEFKITCKDGSNKIVSFKTSFYSDGLIIQIVDITKRKRAEEALREREERYKKIVQTAMDGFWLTDTKGNFLEVNEAYAQMSGYSIEELMNMRISDVETLENSEEIARHIQKGIGIGFDRFETVHRRKDKSTFDVEVNFKYYPFEGGRFVAFLSDITESKKAKMALVSSEKKWRNILVNTPQIGITLNPQARIVFANTHFLKLTGWKEHEVIDQDWFDLFLPAHVREEVREVFRSVMSQKDTLGFSTYENEIITKTGELLNIAWSNVLTKDGQGYVVDVTCLGIDLTERRRAEEALRESEGRFRNIAENSLVGIYIIQDGIFIYANPKFAEIFGYSIEECMNNMHFRQLVYPEDFDTVQEQIRKRESGEAISVNYTFRGIKKSGKVIHVEIFGSSILLKGRAAVTGTMLDITERKQMETHLQETQKMESIGNLAGGIAHDFNNILFPIIGMSELLMDDLPIDSPEHQNVQEILKAGKRGSNLVKQILAFSRQSEQKKIPVRAQQILKEVLMLIRATLPSYIEIEENIQSDCGLLMADPTQIHQIAMNIITNAFHAVESKGGKIAVQLQEVMLGSDELTDSFLVPGRYALLSITDTGHGIPSDLMIKIFEPYFTTKEQGKGTGLGLAVAYGIIKKHKGDIKVYSEIGKGTTFNIYLPLMEKVTGVDKDEQAKGDLKKGNEIILVVDDEEPIAILEKQMLERLGYKVKKRINSIEALEAFKAKPNDFDLVLTDMTMPNMSGDQLARKLKAIRPDIPIIICTGFSERINKENAEAVGINGFLMKPIIISDLSQMVRKVLDEDKEIFDPNRKDQYPSKPQ